MNKLAALTSILFLAQSALASKSAEMKAAMSVVSNNTEIQQVREVKDPSCKISEDYMNMLEISDKIGIESVILRVKITKNAENEPLAYENSVTYLKK